MQHLTPTELLAIPLLQYLSCRDAEHLAGRVYRLNHEKDQLLALEKDWGECIFLIHEGFAKVRSYSEQGDERVFCLLGTGELFGEMSFLDGHSRSADVVALTSISLIKFPGKILMKLIRSNPEFALAIAKLEASRLRDLNRRFSLCGESALTRVLEAIAYIVQKGGFENINQHTSLPDIAQHEIGLLAGLSAETTCRVFRKLRERGVISRHEGTLRILDSDPLQKCGLIMNC